MAELGKWHGSKELKKEFLGACVYLSKGFDLTHGWGWHCHAYGRIQLGCGYGFHKANRFTAVRRAIKEIRK